MGLHIHTLSKIPRDLEKDWYVYLLEYGDPDPFTQAMKACFDEMADWASRGNGVIVKGTDPVHFNDEVLSWHKIGDFDGEKVLPALLISSINPNVFNDFGGEGRTRYKASDKLIIVPLREISKTSDRVYAVIRQVLNDLKQGEKLSGMSVVNPETRLRDRLVNSVILRPTIAGIGIDIKELFK